jgi:signal transduction histidine kinase
MMPSGALGAFERPWQLIDDLARDASREEILAHALAWLRRVLDVERASILLFDRMDVMRFVAWEGLSETYRKTVEGHSPWQRDAKAPEAFGVPDVETDADLAGYRSVFRQEGIRALAFIPLTVAGELIGKFMLYHSAPRTFDAHELDTARWIGGQVAFALELRRTESQLRLARDRLAILAEASEVLATSLDDETSLKRLADFAVSTMADYCITYAFDPPSTIRRVGLAHSVASKTALVEDLDLAGPPEPDGPGAGTVIRTGRPVLVEEIPPGMLENAARNATHLRVLHALQPRSSILVPLSARGRTLGAIAFATTDDSGRRYGAEDLLLAQELAGRASLLVDNARLYREAQEAVNARNDVLAIVSHDLRNPLHTILTACAIHGDPKVAHEQRARSMSIVKRAADRMERLLGDLLEVARIDSGRLALDLRAVSFASVFNDLDALLRPLAGEKNVSLDWQIDASLPRVRADRDRLIQLMANLVGNALKFVSEGGRVDVHAKPLAAGVEVSITDDGPGIPEADLPRIFDRFWQGDSSQRQGTGLGLAITKGLVEAHGGGIRAESRPGQGCRFVFWLPSDRREAASAPASPT